MSTAVYPVTGGVPTTRTLTAGAGMTGGGDLSANRTFDVVANADGSITVNADDVQVGILATDAQHGARGGGTQHANVVAAGAAGFMTGADKTKLDNFPSSAVPTTRLINTTSPLGGGGDLSADRTLTIDTSTFVLNTRRVDTGIGLTGGGALSSNLTLFIDAASSPTLANLTLTSALNLTTGGASLASGATTGSALATSTVAAGSSGIDFRATTSNTRTSGTLLQVDNNGTVEFSVGPTGNTVQPGINQAAGGLQIGASGPTVTASSGTVTYLDTAAAGVAGHVINTTTTKTGTTKVLDVQNNTVSEFSVDAAGNISAAGNASITGTSQLTGNVTIGTSGAVFSSSSGNFTATAASTKTLTFVGNLAAANSGTDIIFNTTATRSAGFAFRFDNNGTTLLRGNTTTGDIEAPNFNYAAAQGLYALGNSALLLYGNNTNGASAAAVKFGSRTSLSNASASLAQFYLDQFGTKQLDIKLSGRAIYTSDSGADSCVGLSAAMSLGTVTISTTSITANSRIQLTHAGTGTSANFGILSVGTITAGTSFVINSSNAVDNDKVYWKFDN